MTTFIASVFVFGLLIVFHEFGHFIVAKIVGIKVYEFSLGFGPKLLDVSGEETLYTVRLLPLGGFVRMAGMDPEEEVDEKDLNRGFNKKTVGQRIAVIFAGPFMNFLLAALLFVVVFSLQGEPVASSGTRIGDINPGYPAQAVGLAAGDKIVAVDGKTVDKWADLVTMINERPEQNISVVVLRDGSELQFALTTVKSEDGRGLIGIYPTEEYVKIGFLQSISLGIEWTVRFTVAIIDIVFKMILGQAPAELGGPVRVVSEIGNAAQLGFVILLKLAALLSVNLGLFNLFPIPALDGSRILFLVWEKIIRRPVDPAKENFIHLIGFGLLMLLIVAVTYNDIIQVFIAGKGAGQ
ncbi:MAG: RIP metalloprotease RseP [Desulfotomaculaceae bacterium]|nr:RIP metalloprotease RseP [Desulfotomaculaceae bacterium]MDD4766011.1 RIP metalloprotease RseP [Desulfotomaculaceae bacterium]